MFLLVFKLSFGNYLRRNRHVGEDLSTNTSQIDIRYELMTQVLPHLLFNVSLQGIRSACSFH